MDVFANYFSESGFGQLFSQWFQWPNLVMIAIGLLFIYLAIKKGFEPLLLVPIGFGILIGNIPYNSDSLLLSVYDGPASEHELHYYAVDLGTLHEDGRAYTPEQAMARLVAEEDGFGDPDLRDIRRTFVAEGVTGENLEEAILQAIAAGEVEAPTMSQEALALLIRKFDATTFERFELIPYPDEGKRAYWRGEAIMVNHHNLLTTGWLPDPLEAGAAPDVQDGELAPAGIVALGQGRQVLVPPAELEAGEMAHLWDGIGRENGKYPQLWSMKRQDPAQASIMYWLYAGVGFGFFPPLIFLGVGALTDFGPMLANPKTLLLGAAAQFGIFGALVGAIALGFIPGFEGFTLQQAGAIGIIGGADGPTAIFTSTQLAPELLGAVALAAYSYMALVPIIQPPIMKLLTTKKERAIRMTQLKPVSKKVRIIFPIVGFLLTVFIANAALPLLGMLFFGNLLRESLVTDRLAKTAQTAFIDIVTILLGVTVGAKTSAANFLTAQTIFIFVLGVTAFIVATATGLIFAKVMNQLSKTPVNPLIGAAGVSAVPMAARVAHKVGQDEDPQNFLLMHAMGPNVAGVLGSAVAAGVLLASLGS